MDYLNKTLCMISVYDSMNVQQQIFRQPSVERKERIIGKIIMYSSYNISVFNTTNRFGNSSEWHMENDYSKTPDKEEYDGTA